MCVCDSDSVCVSVRACVRARRVCVEVGGGKGAARMASATWAVGRDKVGGGGGVAGH